VLALVPMKNILMIVHTFPPIGSVGGSIRIIKFLKYINELADEIKVTLITLRDDFVLLNDPHMSYASLSEIPQKNIEIVRINTLQPRHPNPNSFGASSTHSNGKVSAAPRGRKMLKKIYSLIEKYILIPDYGILWSPYLLKEGLKRAKGADIIYATAPPFSVILQSILISIFAHKRIVLDIKDDWIHQTRFINQPYLFRKIEGWMERFCIRNADKVILVTENSYDDFRKRYPQFINKFELITNGCDIEEYEKYLDKGYAKNTKFTIIHSGVINSSRNPLFLFKAISELKDEGTISNGNFELKFIGPLPEEILRDIKKTGLTDIITNTPVLEREDYIKTIGNADILLAINYQIKTLVPGKIYDYWGSRRPILLVDSVDSAAANLVIKNNLGKVTGFKDTIEIKRIIKDYFAIWKRNSVIEEIGAENLSNFDRKFLTKKLISIFNAL
jgi:glycosyltransferase involved in cell wall biosynthesis